MSLIVLGAITLAMLAVMTLAWAFQWRVGNSGWIDVFWTFGAGLSGVAAALLPFAGPDGPSARQILAAVIIGLWSARLGLYVAQRVAARPEEDARYARYRRDWAPHYQRTLYVLILPQAFVTAGLCVSIMVAAQRTGPLDVRDIAAALVLLAAIAGEALADAQLARFKRTNTVRGAICDVGLWGWSRHPNYFFEWMGWLAWPVMALDPSRPVTWLTLAAPAAMYCVLRFMTGVPPLEQAMLESRGDAFRAYQRRTSAFLPLPPRHGV